MKRLVSSIGRIRDLPTNLVVLSRCRWRSSMPLIGCPSDILRIEDGDHQRVSGVDVLDRPHLSIPSMFDNPPLILETQIFGGDLDRGKRPLPDRRSPQGPATLGGYGVCPANRSTENHSPASALL
jgi:hypothetical protein